jgi:HD-like signal output (HDOD) protein
MSSSATIALRERVKRIEVTPSIPTILLPLMEILKAPPEEVELDEVVRLVSLDSTISAQCLRVASSPLFGLAHAPNSVNAAVIALGIRRVESILLTCCIGQAFPVKNWLMEPDVFWAHSLGTAMVCRRFSGMLSNSDGEKSYAAGLLHDIGFLVNCLVFPTEFSKAAELARQESMPMEQAELATMGFTHCESGEALAHQWRLGEEVIAAIANHHNVERAESSKSLVSMVHLSDLLCRLRGLGYGYTERICVDMLNDPAWKILIAEHDELGDLDLVRFTFELDEAVEEIFELVKAVLGGKKSSSLPRC